MDTVRLDLHRVSIPVTPSSAGRTFVGFRVTPERRKVRNENVRTFIRWLGWLRREFRSRRLLRDDVH